VDIFYTALFRCKCNITIIIPFFLHPHMLHVIHALHHAVPVDDCNEGDVRLVNGVQANEGRVEICFNNQWGTVCDDSWGPEEAQVVCRQLNYTVHLQDSVPFTNAFFGSGLTAIHLDDLNCTGTERRLADCGHSGVGNHNCLHHEDAGVLCIGKYST
jgi:deleted-in-malignant-brain-tumors protein 1